MLVNGSAFRPCALIPCYNHGKTLARVVQTLCEQGLDCLIVDDGSDALTQQDIADVLQQYPQCNGYRLEVNQGKGGALFEGFKRAKLLGYTHALQVDADGQHDLLSVPELLKMAQETPNMLISGQPIYDDSVPKSRLYGRYVTHVWVWIETLSFSIKDSMCGFRVYPLVQTLDVMNSSHVGRHMDFDTEIMVRLYWNGIYSRFLPTHVIYPEQGISHFDVVKDNIRISKMHTRLFFGMLPRIPHLLNKRSPTHWAKTQECRGLAGMRFMVKVYKLLGRKPFQFILFFVAGWFWLTGSQQSTASRRYLTKVAKYCQIHNITPPQKLSSFYHFQRFGEAMLDKVASWCQKLVWGKDVVYAPQAEEVLKSDEEKGKLILGSHLGDIEVCRALAQTGRLKRVNALVFHEHAARFQQLMSEIAPESQLNLISVTNITPDVAIKLQEKIQAGEWVAIVGDRISISISDSNDQRITWSDFLGEPAPFPQGPFILAALLKCPVVLMFALKQDKKITIYSEEFANPIHLPRGSRQAALQAYIDQYAARLTHYTLMSPLDWFNFYDFWQLPSTTSDSKENV